MGPKARVKFRVDVTATEGGSPLAEAHLVEPVG